MSVTVFLRFPSEADAQAMLVTFGAGPAAGEGFKANGSGEFAGARYDYVVVNGQGEIWRPTGTMIETERGPVPELAPVPGYHVNLLWRGDASAVPDFGDLRVYPATPECVFAALGESRTAQQGPPSGHLPRVKLGPW
ncbi:hypothetical protein [Xanthobacter flavus]|uniref:hypothetical protein n=1 Tax=Xanthobacter flavus TaxID=281 RepID=UPI003726C449